MISLYNKPFSDEESLSCLNDKLRAWFTSKYKELTPPQKYSFKLISEGKSLAYYGADWQR